METWKHIKLTLTGVKRKRGIGGRRHHNYRTTTEMTRRFAPRGKVGGGSDKEGEEQIIAKRRFVPRHGMDYGDSQQLRTG